MCGPSDDRNQQQASRQSILLPRAPFSFPAETTRETIEKTFNAFAAREDVGLIMINQPIADTIRPIVNAHSTSKIIPMILEVPSVS
jgi:vacuolar-type H+-ATPase subunit F/Vma7